MPKHPGSRGSAGRNKKTKKSGFLTKLFAPIEGGRNTAPRNINERKLLRDLEPPREKFTTSTFKKTKFTKAKRKKKT